MRQVSQKPCMLGVRGRVDLRIELLLRRRARARRKRRERKKKKGEKLTKQGKYRNFPTGCFFSAIKNKTLQRLRENKCPPFSNAVIEEQTKQGQALRQPHTHTHTHTHTSHHRIASHHITSHHITHHINSPWQSIVCQALHKPLT